MLFSSNKPDWLYNAMPALYLVAGGAVVALERTALALASGVLLMVAGVAIAATRRRHRRRHRDEEVSRMSEHSSIMAPPSRLAATTQFVRAVAPPKLGHADIDRQHRSLASKSATLRVAFLHDDQPADIELLVHELADALAQHLQAEHEAMRRLGVVRGADAVQADCAQLEAFERQLERHRLGQASLQDLVEQVTGALVAEHLKSAHPALPSMESALQRLRDAGPEP
jgi:hemerythrin